MKYFEYGISQVYYFKKIDSQKKNRYFGIWNFLKYKKKITTHGGVKFNQAKKCLSAIAYMNVHISS